MDEINTPPGDRVENLLRLNSEEDKTLAEFFQQLAPLWATVPQQEGEQGTKESVGIQAGQPSTTKQGHSKNLKATIRKESLRRAAHRLDQRLGEPEKATHELRSDLKAYLTRVLQKAVMQSEGNTVSTTAVLSALKDEEEERTGAADTFHRLFGLREEWADDDELMEWPEEDEGDVSDAEMEEEQDDQEMPGPSKKKVDEET
ncbi:MAG: hypothetical protein GY738_10995 [Pseudoalteromonas sp.]|nr:hypothetical protein [Pseudoalteromonas sp.]